MKQFVKFIPVLFALFLFACGSGGDKDTASDEGSANEPVESMVADEVDPMDAIGVGPITSLDLPETVDADMAANGETIFKEKFFNYSFCNNLSLFVFSDDCFC